MRYVGGRGLGTRHAAWSCVWLFHFILCVCVCAEGTWGVLTVTTQWPRTDGTITEVSVNMCVMETASATAQM